MKLSELDASKATIDEVQRLEIWRRETADAIAAIDETRFSSVYVVMSDDGGDEVAEIPDVHPSAWPMMRQVLAQTLDCIEADLRRLGVEIDTPAYTAGHAPEAGNDSGGDVADGETGTGDAA